MRVASGRRRVDGWTRGRITSTALSRLPTRPTRHALPMLRRLAILVVAAVPTLSAQEPFDRAMVAKIRDEGLNRSHVWAMVDTLATVIGPRLTGSPAYMRSATWARDHFK